jgi:hypothetical protein
MANSTDLQGNPANQQNALDSTVLGGSNPTLQNSNGQVALQASPATLSVVGEKQPDPNHFPVADLTVLAVVLIAAIIGVFLWIKD